jgi:hypothetical protein
MTESMARYRVTPAAGPRPARTHPRPGSRTTRRGVQIGLGVLWLLDGALQLQPFMFTTDFARQVLAPAAQGQPQWVAGPIDFFAGVIAAHPAPLNTGFALVQVALGIGFLIPRLVRPAIVASLFWSAGVWVSEGLGGLPTGHASLVTGAPGAVLLYAVLALAAWPCTDEHDSPQTQIPGWFPAAWATLWIGGAVLQLLPGQAGAAALRDQIASTDGAPGWLADLHAGAWAALSHSGEVPFITLVVLMALVGLAALAGPPWRTAAAAAGALAAATFWVLGQNIGQLYSGQATDPNTGPLIILMALALAGTATQPRPETAPKPPSPPAVSTALAHDQ